MCYVVEVACNLKVVRWWKWCEWLLGVGGGRKVTRVEVTMDGGETWQVCRLDHPEKPNKYGKYWCWCFWCLEVNEPDLPAAKEIALRAWDEALNTRTPQTHLESYGIPYTSTSVQFTIINIWSIYFYKVLASYFSIYF